MTEYVSQKLVNAFVAGAAAHFQSLEQRYHLARSLKAEVFGPRGMKSVRPEEVGDRFFWLKLTLAGPAFSVVISYGDREHDIHCDVHRTGFKESYALEDWLRISSQSGLLEDSGGWVLTAERVEAVLAQYERMLESLLPMVVAAGPALELQLEKQRQEYLRQDSEVRAQSEHVRLVAKADEALRRQDYKAVVEMLSAVRVDLTPSERAKLAYARKKLRE